MINFKGSPSYVILKIRVYLEIFTWGAQWGFLRRYTWEACNIHPKLSSESRIRNRDYSVHSKCPEEVRLITLYVFSWSWILTLRIIPCTLIHSRFFMLTKCEWRQYVKGRSPVAVSTKTLICHSGHWNITEICAKFTEERDSW